MLLKEELEIEAEKRIDLSVNNFALQRGGIITSSFAKNLVIRFNKEDSDDWILHRDKEDGLMYHPFIKTIFFNQILTERQSGTSSTRFTDEYFINESIEIGIRDEALAFDYFLDELSLQKSNRDKSLALIIREKIKSVCHKYFIRKKCGYVGSTPDMLIITGTKTAKDGVKSILCIPVEIKCVTTTEKWNYVTSLTDLDDLRFNRTGGGHLKSNYWQVIHQLLCTGATDAYLCYFASEETGVTYNRLKIFHFDRLKDRKIKDDIKFLQIRQDIFIKLLKLKNG